LSRFYYLLVERWRELPRWAKWFFGVFAFLGVISLPEAFVERRPIGSWFEAVVANFLYWGLLIFGFFGALYFGSSISEKRGPWVGWIVGLVIFLLSGFLLYFLSESIPGVGWRIERMLKSDDCLDC
jgi:phosphotransferase system  glucose/maltose/N-acetylglucosamine-specific IIC component